MLFYMKIAANAKNLAHVQACPTHAVVVTLVSCMSVALDKPLARNCNTNLADAMMHYETLQFMSLG